MDWLRNNRSFWALFGTQFFGAFNDNFFRSALVTLITFHIGTYSDATKALFVTAAFGLFMLPFFLFSPYAGQLTDRYEKATVIRLTKIAEILIVGLTSYGFIQQNPYYLLGTLFFMGAQSAFFGPAKYSILPDLLPLKKLLKGNGFIEAGTFLAIMLGTLIGALMIHWQISMYILSALLLVVAILGFIASLGIEHVPLNAPRMKIRYSWLAEMKHLYRFVKKDERLFRAIIGISWFWLLGTVLLSQLPPFAKGILNVQEQVFIFLLMLFTIGIGAGSILSNWMLKGEISTKLVPLLSLLMLPLLFDLSTFTSSLSDDPMGLTPFVTSMSGLHLTFDILALSFLGGVFVVPLFAYIQSHVSPGHRSQVIALSNIINAGFMVFASLASFTLLSFMFTIPGLIFIAAIGHIFFTLYIIRILPDSTLKDFIVTILRLLFRFEVRGVENYKKAGQHVVLVSNHSSYIDALVVAAALPEKPLFAINMYTAQKWWVKPFLVLAHVFPIDPSNPYAIRDVISEAQKGRKVFIFPEGRLTQTGSLMKIYDGAGMVAKKADAKILPMRIEGAEYTYFSVLKGKKPRRLFPKVSVTILPPETLEVDPALVGRGRRHALSEKLYDLMVNMMFTTSFKEKTLFTSLIEAQKLYGGSTPILEDLTRKVLSYGQFITKVFALSRFFSRVTDPEEKVGIMLPNTHVTVVSFWAMQCISRIPAILNFTSGSASLLSACQIAEVKQIFTSREFVERARLKDSIDLLIKKGIKVHYFEDVPSKLHITDKLWGLYGRFFPHRAYHPQDPNDPCVVLFTSGSEGTPKGVVLSHANIQANRYQVVLQYDFDSTDVLLNVLPIFHSSGMIAMVLALLTGIRAFHYVSPLHYRTVVELAYDTNATILFGSDTFLWGYGRVAHPYDFHTLRYVIAGAEKVKNQTRDLWNEKFGQRILEGYGATETSPVLCINTPMHNKAGTVGRIVPKLTHRLEPIKGITEGARLWVKGPNVMLGYYLVANPGVLQPPPDGWYDTGDVVDIDDEGYVRIVGRVKRFAKIGGEMVSLGAVEDAIKRLWPTNTHAILTRPDPKKGERLVLYTTNSKADRTALAAFWKKEGLPEIALPKEVKIKHSLPLLSTGKVNYTALEKEEA